jgi:hypothetical protein
MVESRESAVSIWAGYGLDGRGFGVRVTVETVLVVQTNPWFYPILYPMRTGDSFLWS